MSTRHTDEIIELKARLAELEQRLDPASVQQPATRRSTRSMRARLLALGVLAIALIVPGGVVLASHTFSDVPTSNKFHADIAAIDAANVTHGCGGGKYCPNGLVTRGQMAAFLNRLGALGPGTTPVVNADRLDGLNSTAFVRPLYAAVNADGSLAYRSGDLTVTKTGIGQYRVDFTRVITFCSAAVAVGHLGSTTGTTGTATLSQQGSSSGQGIRIVTRDVTFNLADRPFMLTVTCGPLTIVLPLSEEGG